MNTPLATDPLSIIRKGLSDCMAAAARDFEPQTWRALHATLHGALHALDVIALERLALRAQYPAERAEALTITAIAAQIEPPRAGALFAQGLALQMTGQHPPAIGPYRRALTLDPDWPNLRNNLAAALLEGDMYNDEARQLLEAVVARNPRDTHAWTNLARLWPDPGDLPRALAAGERACALAPRNPLALNAYALMLKEAQRLDESERLLRTANQYAPDYLKSRFNLALAQLVRGAYEEGWSGHELRWQCARELSGGRPVFPKKQWRGEPLAGQTLLLWGEQGMGDLLQFSRYVPLLAERVHREGGRLVWNSFPQMGALLQRSLGSYCDLYSAGGPVESLPPYDCEVSMLSLPLIFQTREDTIPSPGGYLKADVEAVARWRERLSGERRLKVGLAWTGSLTHQRNPFRRVDLAHLARHFAPLGEVAFYSLQPGMDADIAAARAAGLNIADFSAQWQTFDDTAAFVESLDLVVSVCTSIAHLAGALGKRTWVLLDVNPHWVWQQERPDNPWYAHTMLYRQPAFCQWEPVLEAVAADLAWLAGER